MFPKLLLAGGWGEPGGESSPFPPPEAVAPRRSGILPISTFLGLWCLLLLGCGTLRRGPRAGVSVRRPAGPRDPGIRPQSRASVPGAAARLSRERLLLTCPPQLPAKPYLVCYF